MEKVIPLTDITSLAQQLADSLRLGYLAKCHQLTITFIDLLSHYISQNALDNPHLNNVLNVMLDAQQRDDRLYYADILQYELLPLLDQLQ